MPPETIRLFPGLPNGGHGNPASVAMSTTDSSTKGVQFLKPQKLYNQGHGKGLVLRGSVFLIAPQSRPTDGDHLKCPWDTSSAVSR